MSEEDEFMAAWDQVDTLLQQRHRRILAAVKERARKRADDFTYRHATVEPHDLAEVWKAIAFLADAVAGIEEEHS